jgi:hypothetical protein
VKLFSDCYVIKLSSSPALKEADAVLSFWRTGISVHGSYILLGVEHSQEENQLKLDLV